MDRVVLEVALRDARTLRQEEMEGAVKLSMGKFLSRRRPEKGSRGTLWWLHHRGELESSQRLACTALTALTEGKERWGRRKVGAERVVLRDAVLQENAVAWT